MSSITDELVKLKMEFESLEDGIARYTYLIELSKLLPKYDGICCEKNLFKGCQSQVWLDLAVDDGKCTIKANSDTLIIRGILYIFISLLDRQPIKDVLEADFDVLQELGIEEYFFGQRKNGVLGLLPEIIRRLKGVF